jgi:stage III sporulation protein AE
MSGVNSCKLNAFIGESAAKKQSRRFFKRLALLCALCLMFALSGMLFVLPPTAASAESASLEELEQQLVSAVDSLLKKLDTDDFQKYIDSLSAEQKNAVSIGDLKAVLKKLTNGEQESFFGSFFELLGKAAGTYFAGFVPSLLTVVIICLLKNMLSGMTSGFANNSTTEVVHIICYSAIIVVLMSGVISVIKTVTKTVAALSEFADIVFPVLLTILSMLDGASTVAVFQPMTAVLSSVILKIIIAVIIPAFIATIVFSVVGNISKNVKLDKLTKLIKSASSWLIGVVFGLYGAFLTMQGITGGISDRFGFNAAKFAVSSYVPILGGYLSDGFDLLTASLVLVKNAFGFTGGIVLMAVVLFPLLKLVTFILSLRLTAAIVEPIGDERVAGMLHSLANNTTLLVSALIGAAFMFFVVIMLIIGTCNMGV